MIKSISLEQWLTFKTIVDAGSYAAAAEQLNKSQSSISYIMTKLAEHSPTPLLVTEGRKAVLTDAGRVMYRHANNLLEQANQVEKTLEYLAKGWESEVVLALDAIASIQAVFCGLQEFSKQSPRTRIKLLETTLSGTDEAIITKQADLAVTPNIPPGFLGEKLGLVTMVAVVSPNHPLHRTSEAISDAELKNHRQIVVRDSGLKRQQDVGWLGSEQRWTVSHFSSSIAAVKAGLGFAFVPQHKIQEELNEGSLHKLKLTPSNERQIPLYLVSVNQHNPGPATKAVAQHLIDRYR